MRPLLRIASCACFAHLIVLSATSAVALDLPKGGINLNGHNYWNPATPFNELSNMGNGWISYPTGTFTWNDGRPIPLTPDGYPASLLPDQSARTLIHTHNNSIYPTGNYEVTWEGTGTLQMTGGALVNSGTGMATYHVTNPNFNGLLLSVTSTSASDPVRNIQVAAPGADLSQQPFNTDYADDLANYGVIRYMDWNATNSHPVSQWSDRNTPTSFHWGNDKGVPYEVQIEYSNYTQQDMWVTVPHLADDAYVQNLAQLINNDLQPGLRVWVEYSNEVWNGIFSQHHHAANVLVPQYGGNISPMQAYGRRSAEIFSIFEQEITDPDGLIKVAAGQAANSWQLNQALIGIDASGTTAADVAAIAPYFRFDSAQMDALYTDYLSGSVDMDQIFIDLHARIDLKAIDVANNAFVANNYNIPLVAYEGGQHLVATTNTQRNDAGFVDLLADINRDGRMKDLYEHHLQEWNDAGGKTFTFFNDVGSWGRSGYWGMKETLDDTDSPKFLAVQEYLTMNMGDFDADGSYGCADVDALVAEIAAATNNSQFDLTGDGNVDVGDLDAWLTEAGANELTSGNSYIDGDANLDGVVDISDYNIWLVNRTAMTAAWCDADFTADGVVDDSDFAIWNANRFQSADQVQASVPEPASWTFVLLALAAFVRYRQSSRHEHK